ncbi:MAG: TolC family protein [Candidatus Latescibacterota bacterium]|jgi:cobalt-zinc-cadmium efflux system outer membrane protein
MSRCIGFIFLAIGFFSLGLDANLLHAQKLTREKAVEFALENNPLVVAAGQEWQGFRARITQVRAIPGLELELEYEELPAITRLGDFGARSYGATQTIEFPLKWWRRGQAAKKASMATRLTVLEMTRLNISTRVKMAFDRVLAKEKSLDYISQNAQLAEDFLHKAQQRLAAGDVPQLEVLRAEVEAGRAANRVSAAHSDWSVAKAELNTLLAKPSRTPLEMDGDLNYRPVELELEKLQSLALQRRPDFLGAEWAVESSLSTQGAARAAFMPDLNIGLFRQTIRGATGEEGLWRVGLALEFPLWGAARKRGELAEAKAAVGQATAVKNDARNQMLLEIESAFIAVQSSEKQVLLFQGRIAREAERSFEVASRSYAEGKATYLELLEAQKALVEVREEYIAALFNYRFALYQLERASGGPLD